MIILTIILGGIRSHINIILNDYQVLSRGFQLKSLPFQFTHSHTNLLARLHLNWLTTDYEQSDKLSDQRQLNILEPKTSPN